MAQAANVELPGLDCGLCGYRTCDELLEQLPSKPELLKRCIHLSDNRVDAEPTLPPTSAPSRQEASATSCGVCAQPIQIAQHPQELTWRDNLGREFDFYLEHFPEEPGPREIILPHNPLITREMEIQVGDILIGRPLGMSCGCPITHCGVAMEVDRRTGVIVWCVTGPLGPRAEGLQGPWLLYCRGLRGIGQRNPL